MRQSRLSQPWAEQQRLIAIPADWQLDDETCKLGLEAVKRLRAILNADGIDADSLDADSLDAGNLNADSTRKTRADSRAVAASFGD